MFKFEPFIFKLKDILFDEKGVVIWINIKLIYSILIIGFLSILAQLWLQNKTLDELNTKMESV